MGFSLCPPVQVPPAQGRWGHEQPSPTVHLDHGRKLRARLGFLTWKFQVVEASKRESGHVRNRLAGEAKGSGGLTALQVWGLHIVPCELCGPEQLNRCQMGRTVQQAHASYTLETNSSSLASAGNS